MIQRREGHFSLVHRDASVITCGGQYLAELYASCEAFDVKGKRAKKKKLPDRESNPGRRSENPES